MNGTVTGSGINCPGTCTAMYGSGASVTLTATFNPPGPTPGTASAFVTRLYQQVLSREPDPVGLQAFIDQISQFDSVVPTVLAFFHSQEFLARNTSNTEFVTLLYRVFLNRVPDPGGLATWVDRLNRGVATRDQLLTQFAASPEFQAILQQLCS